MPASRPHVVAHVAVALDGSTRGFEPDVGRFYEIAAAWAEDVTLVGADTILAQEEALATQGPGPGPNPDGPLLAVVDSRERVTAWQALRDAGHWRDAVPLRPSHAGERVDLRAALQRWADEGSRTVRVDSGGRLIGVLLQQGLLDEVSLLVHPCLGAGQPWTDGVASGVRFTPRPPEALDHGLVWLRYDVA